MSCCTSTLSLGCFNSCEDISTGLTATSSGTWSVKVNLSKIVQFDLTQGEEIIIPGGYFSEDSTVVFQIFKPDGNLFESEDYDCFKIQTNAASTTPTANYELEYGSNQFVS